MRDYDQAEVQHDFRGLDWRHLHPDFLSLHSSALGFFTPLAFRYFIPAYLIADILEVSGNANPVFHLADVPSERQDSFSTIFYEKVGQLNGTERRAVIDYLRFQLEQGCEFDHAAIEKALANYWLRPRWVGWAD